MSLLERAKRFVESGDEDQFALLHDCVEDGGILALAAVQLVAEDMYGGITFNFEIKYPAAIALLTFGEPGIRALAELAERTPTTKNRSLCLGLLGAAAAGRIPSIFSSLVREQTIRQKAAAMILSPSIQEAARTHLREYVLNAPDEGDITAAIGGQLQTAGWYEDGSEVTSELFAALAARKLAISPANLAAYERLIKEQADDEPAFHAFLARHPQLLDPMAAEVWSKPDLSGAKEPDFVIRRTDDTYLVVEIEKPAKPLMTSDGQLSAPATQSVAQATAYRGFLMERFPLAAKHFPRFAEPECLVVIGLEGRLTDEQRSALARENRSRVGLRIVGFDWLAARAVAVFHNVVEPKLTSQSIRVF